MDGYLLIARRREKLEAIAAELGEGAVVLPADLGTVEGLETVRTWLEENHPEVRYLINAAGFGIFGDYSEVSEAETVGMIDLNVKGLVLMTNMVIPYMVKGGNILELGSASVFTPLPRFNIYASTKAFVYHYTQALAYELRPHGIYATVLCPGWVLTEFFDRAENDRFAGPRKKKPMLSADYVVRCAMKSMRRGKILCTCNWYTKMQHLLSKLAPNRLMIAAWQNMCKK